MGKDFKKHFAKEDIGWHISTQKDDQHRWPKWELQVKAMVRQHNIPIKKTKIKYF